MVVNYTGVGCAEEQGNNHCQWRSNLEPMDIPVIYVIRRFDDEYI